MFNFMSVCWDGYSVPFPLFIYLFFLINFPPSNYIALVYDKPPLFISIFYIYQDICSWPFPPLSFLVWYGQPLALN